MTANHGANLEIRKVGGRQYAMSMQSSLKLDGISGIIVMSALCFLIMLFMFVMHGAPFIVFCMAIAWLTLRGRRLVKRYYFAAFLIGLVAQLIVSL